MASQKIHVEFLPLLTNQEKLAGQTVVVIDVLRATSTIMMALTNGANCVIPCASLESARQTHQQLGPDSILGGERGGQIVEGFHHGNSPLEYTNDAIGGKTIVLATTNGTVAMEQCRLAARTFIGSFLNLNAVVEAIEKDSVTPDIAMLCSGTNGEITHEDVLCAGALVEILQKLSPDSILSDAATIAVTNWQASECATGSMTPSTLHRLLEESLGGQNLIRIGHTDDVKFCSQTNTMDRVAELNVESWKIRLIE